MSTASIVRDERAATVTDALAPTASPFTCTPSPRKGTLHVLGGTFSDMAANGVPISNAKPHAVTIVISLDQNGGVVITLLGNTRGNQTAEALASTLPGYGVTQVALPQ